MSDRNFSQARRTRRSVVKAAALVLSALTASSVLAKTASADDGEGGNQGGNNGGNNGGGGGGGACFLRGTGIRTVNGYRRIETLKPGDLLPTRFGGSTPVLKVDSYVVARGGDEKPVRVTRSALDDNVPATDLWLTAPHAIYMDGILISIGNLVNGSTISFDHEVGGDELEFFHIELATHDVIDAEGAACESLLTPSMARCVPRLALDGRRSELKSRLRSAAAMIVDRRTPLDIVRDRLEERGLSL